MFVECVKTRFHKNLHSVKNINEILKIILNTGSRSLIKSILTCVVSKATHKLYHFFDAILLSKKLIISPSTQGFLSIQRSKVCQTLNTAIVAAMLWQRATRSNNNNEPNRTSLVSCGLPNWLSAMN